MEDFAVNLFTTTDYLVFVAVLLASIGIGIFFGYRDKLKSTDNFFLGNRQLSAFSVGVSFVVTFQSSVLILGNPAETYGYGMQYSIQVIGIAIAYLAASEIVVPIFHPLQVRTVYEYYALRYEGLLVRNCAMCMGIAHYTLYMGIVLYGTALAFESVTGLPQWVVIFLFSSVAVVYTSLGGLKAVIWTDVFQATVMATGILAVLVKSIVDSGGIMNVFELGKSRLNTVNFDPNPTIRHTFWTLSLGATTQYFFLTITQSGTQRINATPSMAAAKRMLYVVTPVYILYCLTVQFQGMTIFSYFSYKGCDPMTSGQITNINKIVPFTMMELFHTLPGLPGLFISALGSAALSTVSSGLSSLAAITYDDIIIKRYPNLKDSFGIKLSKLIVVGYGIVGVGFAFLFSTVKGPLAQILLSFMGAISGPETGLYICSIFFKRARPKAVTFATIISVAFILWINLGQYFTQVARKQPFLPSGPTFNCPNTPSLNETLSNEDRYSMTTPIDLDKITLTSGHINDVTQNSPLHTLYSVSYMYFSLLGTIIVIVIGVVGSLMTQPKHRIQLHPNVILPLITLVPPCLRCLCKRRRRIEDMETGQEMGSLSKTET